MPTWDEGVRHGVGKLSRRATRLVEDSSRSEVGARSYDGPKFRESKSRQFRDSTLGVPGQRTTWAWARWSTAENTIWGKLVLPLSPGRGESSESKGARGLSQHQKGAEWVLTNLWLVLDVGPCNKIIVPLPSLIPCNKIIVPLPSLILKLLARPSYPFQCWKSGAAPKFQLSAIQHT
jgi:hypothetical protein